MKSAPDTADMSAKIRITRIQNRAYIFNADDYLLMRSKHRIVGTLVGCAPACPRNPNVNGLPAVLSACELRLLSDQQLIIRQSSADLTAAPNAAAQAAYAALCDRSLDEQRAHQRACKLNESRKQIERILEGKRQKMRAAGAAEDAVEALSGDQVLAQIGEQCVFSAENALRQVPTAGSGSVWYGFDESDQSAAAAAAADVGDVDVDAALSASLPYRVFRDLWQRGKYVTAGDTFGGTFLVYPGDPALYHASHIVHCVSGGRLDAERLVAGGRLSVLVNKLCVFAYEAADGGGGVAYQTIEWEGKEADVEVQFVSSS